MKPTNLVSCFPCYDQLPSIIDVINRQAISTKNHPDIDTVADYLALYGAEEIGFMIGWKNLDIAFTMKGDRNCLRWHAIPPES